jgi:nucleoside-diphosphate-sugar epimerase
MKILIIGGAGVTGSVIVKQLLQRGCEVTVLGRGQRALPFADKVKTLVGDPYAKDGVKAALDGKQFDAAIVTYGRLRYVAQQLVGHTTRLISVGGAAPVYKGWGDMMAPNPWETTSSTPLFLSEDHPLASAATEDRFSLAVRKTESDVMELHKQGALNVTHFRYPLVYGTHNICPAEWGLVRRALEKRSTLILPNGGLTLVSRGFADNIAHGILLALEQAQASAGQVYNICDVEVLHNHEWVTRVSRLLKHDFDLVDIPFSVLPTGFRATPPQLLYRHHCVMSTEKLQRQLGYRDVVSVDDALERTVSYYVENPLPAGHEAEINLGDPFDYAYEDAFVALWQQQREQFVTGIARLPAPKVIWKHPYAT